MAQGFTTSANVRFWLQADLRLGPDLRLLYPQEQTFLVVLPKVRC